MVRTILADPRVADLVAKCHVNIYGTDSWVARERLPAPVTFQEPAGKGGKVLATSRSISPTELVEMLAPHLEPKPAPAPRRSETRARARSETRPYRAR